jgi:hypothetical protein
MHIKVGASDEVTTGNEAVDLGQVIDVRNIDRGAVMVENTGDTNTASFTALGSFDRETWSQIGDAVEVDAGETGVIELVGSGMTPFAFAKVQVASAVEDSDTDARIVGGGLSSF